MANLVYSLTLTANTSASAPDVETKFSDVKIWLNNRDNATDNWLKLAVTGNATVGGTFGVTGLTTFTGNVALADGSASSPSLNFTSATTTGIYAVGANRLGLVANGSTVATCQSGIMTISGLILTSSDGTVSAPAIAWSTDLDNGAYRIGTNNWALSAGGAKVIDMATTVVNIPVTLTIGTGALATNATDGFLYIPSCAGTPTGTPTTVTGRVPMIYDTTNHKFYIYDGSWRGGTVPGVFS